MSETPAFVSGPPTLENPWPVGELAQKVFDMRHVGLGDLLERLEKLKAQLAAEGLFSPERKRPLPFLPSGVGLITGKDSDAEKDVLRNAQLRWPSVRFEVVHTAVQGDRTAREVARAIARLDADPAVDVIIVARGGGDFQNLLGFSDEAVVRAAAAATTPIVSAIGHEADTPLLDLVADLRASTPTDAAKRVVPDVGEELSRVDQARSRIRSRIAHLVSVQVDRVEQIRSRPVLANPRWIVDSRSDDLTRFVARGDELVTRVIEREGDRVRELAAHLRALSPQRTLDRGYAIVQDGGGHIVRQADAAPAGASLTVTVAEGAFDAVSSGARSDR